MSSDGHGWPFVFYFVSFVPIEMTAVHMWHSTSLELLEGFDAGITNTNTGQASRKKCNEHEKKKKLRHAWKRS